MKHFFSLTVFATCLGVTFLFAQSETKIKQPLIPVSGNSPLGAEQKIQALDESKLTPLQKQFSQTARRGAEWLYRVNTVKGRFLNGIRPALRVEMEEENFLHQTQAALALARAAKIFQEEKYAVRASQTLLLLLEETVTDPANPSLRYTMLPSPLLDRRLSAAMLLLAIHELPNPQPDLLEQGEQLANYLRTRLEAKGVEKEIASEDIDGRGSENAAAITALLVSNRARPAPWKIEVASKAIAERWKDWQSQKESGSLPWRMAALCQAYQVTKEKPYAGLCFEMAQTLCFIQYTKIDPKHADWYGGFKNPGPSGTETPPSIRTAWLAGGLAQACVCARASADPIRLEQFQANLESALQFTQTMQYSESNTIHFAEWFRSRMLGGFYHSARDGDLRLDFTSQALKVYLEHREVFGGS
ncbi:MAG: hypothetical protein EXR99_05990 [Gemmataceae bacterium]|nr:hypothetical protein [Gemmataceae bacterium]